MPYTFYTDMDRLTCVPMTGAGEADPDLHVQAGSRGTERVRYWNDDRHVYYSNQC